MFQRHILKYKWTVSTFSNSHLLGTKCCLLGPFKLAFYVIIVEFKQAFALAYVGKRVYLISLCGQPTRTYTLTVKRHKNSSIV